MFAGSIQLKNYDFIVKNKKSAVGVNTLNSVMEIKCQKKLDFMKIGENHSDFASCKLITIFCNPGN